MTWIAERSASKRLASYLRSRLFDPWDGYPVPAHSLWASDPLWSNPGDGNAVASWRNASGGGDPLQGTSEKRPTFTEHNTAYNAKATVTFAGAQNLYYNISNVAQPWVIVVVGNTSGANGVAEKLMSTLEQSNRGVGDSASDEWAYYLADSGGAAKTGGTSDSAPHVFTLVGDGASSALYVDGSLVVSGDAGTSNWFWLFIGGAGTSTITDPLTGNVAFLGMYSTKTSRDADIQSLEAGLAAYYGITL